MKPYLSVVIPAYNEARNFRDGVLDQAIGYLKKQKYSWEVLLVNDGSTDDTKVLLEGFCKKNRNCRLMTISHGGKAAAVTAGMLAAGGEMVVFTDFDQSTPLNQIEKFIKEHKAGAGVVVGDRGGMGKMNNTLFRRIRSMVFVTLVNIILLPGIRDSQCGFKSFTGGAAKEIFKSLKVTRTRKVTGGYMGAFDVEVLYLARKFGYKIVQVPVIWKNVEGTRLNPWLEPLKMLCDTVKVRLTNYDYHSNTAAD
ncbi:MAG: glycosyltransferase [Patescibacteria group bacterium]|nr:glycosyltransferase [Patescibacteria group bacterium]MCL5431563.1 glycosyltransferase [Patescibacteria group bacterium]